MKKMLWLFLLFLGLMLSWNTVIAVDSFFVLPVKGQFTSWDKKISGSTRFKPVLDGEAVLDRETGLVWERSLCSPLAPPNICVSLWTTAVLNCWQKEIGGRRGWRLPKLEEFLSLVDMSESSPALPKDHPFNNVRSNKYWTSTIDTGDHDFALVIDFANGAISSDRKFYDTHYTWCVRGGYADY